MGAGGVREAQGDEELRAVVENIDAVLVVIGLTLWVSRYVAVLLIRETNVLVSFTEELSIGFLDICIACHASSVSNQ